MKVVSLGPVNRESGDRAPVGPAGSVLAKQTAHIKAHGPNFGYRRTDSRLYLARYSLTPVAYSTKVVLKHGVPFASNHSLIGIYNMDGQLDGSSSGLIYDKK